MSQAPTRTARCTIVIKQDDGPQTEHRIIEGRSVFIGSSLDCGIHIDARDVDEMHCLVSFNDGTLSIQDWGSSTGTIVNGEAIDAQVNIYSDDEVQIGSVKIAKKPRAASRSGDASPDDAGGEEEGDLDSQIKCVMSRFDRMRATLARATEKPQPMAVAVNERPQNEERGSSQSLQNEPSSFTESTIEENDSTAEQEAERLGSVCDEDSALVDQVVSETKDREVASTDEVDATGNNTFELVETETVDRPTSDSTDYPQTECEQVCELLDIESVAAESGGQAIAGEEAGSDFELEIAGEVADDECVSDSIGEPFSDVTCVEILSTVTDMYSADEFVGEGTSGDEIECSDGSMVESMNSEIDDSRTPAAMNEDRASEEKSATDVSEMDSLCSRDETEPESFEVDDQEYELEIAEPRVSGWGVTIREDVADENDALYGQETVDLLLAEVEELRTLLTSQARDSDSVSLATVPADDTSSDDMIVLQDRIDDLLAEIAEQEERVETLTDLLETNEYKEQSELEERQALESWLGDIEKRIGQRETEWQAELDVMRAQLETTRNERDETQRQLGQIAARYDAPEIYQETIEKMQSQQDALREELEATQEECVSLKRALEDEKCNATDAIRAAEARLAAERAQVSRLQYELSDKLSDIDMMPEPKHAEDRDVFERLRLLRTELRAINEHQRKTRESKGDSLISRLSNLWKRKESV